MSPPPALPALAKALTAEHAAVYAYGLIAARASGKARDLTTAAYHAHRARRDRLRALIVERGGTPPETEAAYALPFTPRSSADALRLAALIEDGMAAVYLELVATDDRDIRRMAALALQETATRAYTLRPTLTALPGYPRPTPSPSSVEATPSVNPGRG